MISAYIFIHTLSGSQPDLKQAHDDVHKVPGVKTVHFLTGPTDAIAFVELPDLDALGNTVGKIRGVKGVASTDTRVVLPM